MSRDESQGGCGCALTPCNTQHGKTECNGETGNGRGGKMHVTLIPSRDVDTVVSSHQEYRWSRNCDLNLIDVQVEQVLVIQRSKDFKQIVRKA